MEWLFSILHRCLLRLPPETAHRLGMIGLRAWQWLAFRVLQSRWRRAPAIQVSGLPRLTFRNRVGLAAGFDKSATAFAGLARLGFGFIEIGTVTPLAQSGNPRPRLWRIPPRDLINHMGFNNCGLEEFRRHILRYRPFVAGIPLFANIGKNRATPNERAIADYRQGVEYLSACVDGFVINLSSPNTPGLIALQTEAFLESLAAILPPSLPAFLKLSPDLGDAGIAGLCEYIARSSRFTGVVLTNTSRELADRLHGAPEGGLSGESLAERSRACVSLAREKLPESKVIIGSGGLVDAARVKQMRDAGADLVELYTGLVYRGPRLVREACEILGEE